ncbi:PTS glucose transporter subunit IIA [Williamsia sp. CHRR-6]|uniref:PTS sugar transporter subunit IIA n=1 Tax=Williamsia sp. CHRR-6 TaxID=2835871 RepID=UPI001BDA7086|nr:PTS glucose transporter subunit IIA [Williamsia sp. CHRR-6]MBT0568550.1 PTS glucose transporter subunit IIA [Williamsia sp. CHRR-6]
MTGSAEPALSVRAPLGGTATALAQVPDPVFATEMVGSGRAIEPAVGLGPVEVVAPVSGRLVKVHPHAFVILTESGVGVLVHLGIDTVRLGGSGFTVHTADATHVEVGCPMITWDPDAVRAQGYCASCPVVVMDSAPGQVRSEPPVEIARGAELFAWAPTARGRLA